MRRGGGIAGVFVGGVIVAALAFVGWVISADHAEPHEAAAGWSYPTNCCGGDDCSEIAREAVEQSPEGWRIKISGEVIPYLDLRVRLSGDGRFHRCVIITTGLTRCLFVPAQGA